MSPERPPRPVSRARHRAHDALLTISGVELKTRSTLADAWLRSARVTRTAAANGAALQRWHASTEPAVGLDPARAVWFEQRVRVQPGNDQWYAVDTTGSTKLDPICPNSRPWALTAPLFVDADGDGEFCAR